MKSIGVDGTVRSAANAPAGQQPGNYSPKGTVRHGVSGQEAIDMASEGVTAIATFCCRLAGSLAEKYAVWMHSRKIRGI